MCFCIECRFFVLPMSTLKKLFSETAIYGLSSIVGRLLSYLLTPLYTYNLIPSEYGVVTEMYAYVTFLGIILTYGMETAFFRFYTGESNKKSVFATSLVSLLSTSFLFLLLIWAFRIPLATILNGSGNPEMAAAYASYIVWFAWIVSIDAITAIPFARLRANNRPIRFAMIKLVNIFSYVFFNLFFILGIPYLKSHGYLTWLTGFFEQEKLVNFIFLSNLISSSLTLFMLLPELRFSFKDFDQLLWNRMIKYAIPILIMGLAGMVNETFDRIMMKYLLPLPAEDIMHQIGVYGACYKLSIIMSICVQAFRYAAEPFFFSRHQEGGGRKIYAQVMTYFVFGCCLVFLGTMLYMDAIKFFIGKTGSQFLEGLLVVPYLLMANLCLGVYYNLAIWFKLTDRPIYGSYMSIFGAILTLFLNWIWIPQLGYLGASYTTLVCYGAMMLISYAWGQKHFPIEYDLGKFFFMIGFALALYALSLWLEPSDLVLKSSLNTVWILLFAGVTYFVIVKNYLKFIPFSKAE